MPAYAQAAKAPPPAAPPAPPAAAPAAAAAPAGAPPVVAPPPAPPGSLGGTLLLPRGGVPKHGVIYLDGVPSGSWSVPRERVVLSLRTANFYPDFLVIPVGQTVALANNDRLIHSPFSISATKPFELGRALPGETRTITFERPGVVDLFCNIHDSMQAVIVVVPSTYYALLAPDGSFQVGGVPAGRYRLIGYSPEVSQAEQLSLPVEIHSHERTTLKLQFGQSASSREKLK